MKLISRVDKLYTHDELRSIGWLSTAVCQTGTSQSVGAWNLGEVSGIKYLFHSIKCTLYNFYIVFFLIHFRLIFCLFLPFAIISTQPQKIKSANFFVSTQTYKLAGDQKVISHTVCDVQIYNNVHTLLCLLTSLYVPANLSLHIHTSSFLY